MSLLELSQVTKSFGEVRALRGVSFDLQPGEVHALLGENGAGKSTLIKIISGAHHADTGDYRLGGKAISHLNPAEARSRGVAVIYQQPALFPDLTVAENLAMAFETVKHFKKIDWKKRLSVARQWLERAGAEIDPQSEVRELSMPEQQLVEIAKALGMEAQILVMDEPTASLTTREVEILLRLIDKLRAGGTGIIYITHRLEEVFQIADRVTVLRDGVSVGTRNVKSTNPNEEKHLTKTELIQMMVGRELNHIYPPRAGDIKEVVLEARDLGCSASGIRNINFQLSRGEILGFAGLVGAGRTELARILFGVTPADQGKIYLEGNEIEICSPTAAIHAGIAYLPEDRRRHGVILEMTVGANITLAAYPMLSKAGWLKPEAEGNLSEKFMSELAIKAPSSHARAGNLSGGNQQKVGLSRWMATKPKVLILDEPTQGVDIGAKAEIHKLIRRLAAEGLAILLISSDLPEVVGMSDRIVVLTGGKIRKTLPGNSKPEEIMQAALSQENAA